MRMKGHVVVTVWKNRSNRRTHNTDNETTGSTFGDYVIDDITSEKIQMLLPPVSSDNENTPTRPPSSVSKLKVIAVVH